MNIPNFSLSMPTGADGSEPADEYRVADEGEELTGYKKFLTVGKGVTLVRFKGKDRTTLIARRVGTSGMPNAIFEIDVWFGDNRVECFKDSHLLFEMRGLGVNNSRLEKMAVSALHRWFEDHRPSQHKRRQLRKLRESAEQEVAQ